MALDDPKLLRDLNFPPDIVLTRHLQVIAAPDPIFVAAPLDVEINQPPKVAPAPIKPITTDLPKKSRVKRDACSPQPVGSGPTPTPDTADAFTSEPRFSVRGLKPSSQLLAFIDQFLEYGKQCPSP